MVASLVIQAIIAVTLGFMLLLIFKQQGRILLRLDSLELAAAVANAPTELVVGTIVQDFQLPSSIDKKVSISEFRGRGVLLVYWSPDCGFCDLLAPDLAALEPALKKNNIEVVLASHGDSAANRKLVAEHELTCTVLLVDKSERDFEVFKYRGTPSAYLLDEQGRVSKALATGMDEVLQLAREAATRSQAARGEVHTLPLTVSRIVRDGLKAGTPAPIFSLPAIGGGTVALDQFRGRKVLLVFSDPQCGPCDHLAPKLAKLHREHANNGMAVVMVGRGDMEQNKNKAAQHGMGFPVAVQEKWKLSRQYGIFATPVAFLIGKDGVILRNVATGPDEIMALANEGLSS